MSQWYQHNHRLFRQERKALAASRPLMMLSVVGPGFQISPNAVTATECAIAHGTYILKAPNSRDEIEYSINLLLPKNYPKSPPIMFCNDPKLPIDTIDRHILRHGQACLEVRPEIKRRWPPRAGIVDFLVNLVEPFLAWQAYYDAFGEPPEWGERAHGMDGIIGYYADLLGVPKDTNLLGFIKLLTRKNRPKGHEPCPCNSGLKLRHCHRDSIYKVWEELCQEEIKNDLATIEKSSKCIELAKE